MSNIPACSEKKRIVIIGAGFGGLKLSDKLDGRYFDVILLDKNNYHQFQPLFYQVAISGLEPSSISYPLRKNFQKRRNVHFRMCTVTSVDTERNTVHSDAGSVAYDYLVIANGCDTNFFGNSSLKETTITLKSIPEALYARNRILQSFESAALTTNNDNLEKLLTFVVVGGGATGVELAGAIADMRNYVLPKDYPEVDFSKMKIHLVNASPRLLQAMSEHASEVAAKSLKKRGVIVQENVSVSSYENGFVTTSDGKQIASDNVLWVAGVTGNRLEGLAPTAYAKGNRLNVDTYCKVKGYEDIFAIGDIAYMETETYPKGHPQVAQGAIQMSKQLAKNFSRQYKGGTLRPFEYKDKGTLATIGRSAAVADIKFFKFGGKSAWWLWLLVHLYSIVGFKNKLFVFFDWAWNYFTYDASLRLLIKPVIKVK